MREKKAQSKIVETKKINTIVREKGKYRTGKGKPMTENEEIETIMMCWEVLKDSLGKETHT